MITRPNATLYSVKFAAKFSDPNGEYLRTATRTATTAKGFEVGKLIEETIIAISKTDRGVSKELWPLRAVVHKMKNTPDPRTVVGDIKDLEGFKLLRAVSAAATAAARREALDQVLGTGTFPNPIDFGNISRGYVDVTVDFAIDGVLTASVVASNHVVGGKTSEPQHLLGQMFRDDRSGIIATTTPLTAACAMTGTTDSKGISWAFISLVTVVAEI